MSLDQLIGVATLSALILGGIDWILRVLLRRRRGAEMKLLKTIDRLHAENNQLTEERGEARREAEAAAAARAQAQASQAEAEAQRDEARAERDRARFERDEAQAGLADAGRKAGQLQRRVRKALSTGGQLWVQEAMRGAPRFRPLAARGAPVVSVLNLKGGVGKTTLTAHLGWALARRGYRVLLVDLDLQGSLSSLFLGGTALAERDEAGQNLRHYLETANQLGRARLLDYAHAPLFGNKSALVPTTDRQAYAEMTLTFQWLLRMGHPVRQWNGRRDARFLLRRGLHAGPVRRKFDVVLLDCPPIINLSCVNALAASDYVLVPSTCNRKATERVPPLITRLKELQAAINPDLKVMGLVASRTRGADGLSAPEQTAWNQLVQHARDALGLDVYSFRQPFPDRTEVRNAADHFAPPAEGGDLFWALDRLAEEFERKLPRDCQRTAEMPAQPQ